MNTYRIIYYLKNGKEIDFIADAEQSIDELNKNYINTLANDEIKFMTDIDTKCESRLMVRAEDITAIYIKQYIKKED